MASSAGTTRRDDATARGLSVVRPPEPMDNLALVLAELLTWLRARNPAPAAPDREELLHTRFMNLDPPLTAEQSRAKLDATLARLRRKAGRMQLQELQTIGLTVRLEAGKIMVSPATLVTEEVRGRIERGREYLFAALQET